MPDPLAAAIAARFPHASCVADAHGLRVELEASGAPFRARVQMSPASHVAVQLPSTDGFELALRWTDRAIAGTRAASFDDTCLVETNDVSLANVWLDGEACAALLASRYVSGTPDPLRSTLPMLLDGTWHHELRSDEDSAQTEGEASPERIGDMLAACLALATRPLRWARWFAPVAKALGGDAAPRVELGGKPVLRFRRGTTEVTVRLLRRLGPADHGRLRTVVGAHRAGSGGETLTLIA
ncbi:MAG: hypothetical protein HOV81_30070, partial [Kofleriaceae bacterium]|nr:hypothetical protein [Kofleriaceae bacterium]